jgi:hypothetical protein
MINPFIGYNFWDQEPDKGLPKTLSKFDTDNSGTKTYNFNVFGFRGEEFLLQAKKRIYFSGCSYTFGMGLNYDETAAYKFKMLYCQKLGLFPSDVNLLNFAMPGASNDYIARTMISQCKKVKPDIAIVMFTHVERAEYIDEEALGEIVWTAAPWWIEERPENPLKPLTDEIKERIEIIRNASIGFFYYSTPANLMQRFLTNVLLLQYYFIVNNIPYIFHWVEHGQFNYLKTHYALSDMAELLQIDHFIDHSDPSKYWMDKAADNNHHPGPESNTNIAKSMFQKYCTLYGA